MGEDSWRSMLWWRVTVANDVQFYDGMSNTSLTRVCSGDHSSILAASQMLKKEIYAAYLRNSAGQAWVTLCIAVWLTVVSTEPVKIWSYNTATLSLKHPPTGHTGIYPSGWASALRRCPVAWFLVMVWLTVAPRLFVHVLLGYLDIFQSAVVAEWL